VVGRQEVTQTGKHPCRHAHGSGHKLERRHHLGKGLDVLKLVLVHASVNHVLKRKLLIMLGLLPVRVLLESLRQ
jgi:hypothetical protein